MKRFACVFACLPLVLCCGCGKKEDDAQSRQPRATPVVVASAERTDVPLQVRAIGNVEAFSSVQVRAQVGGILQRVYFKEGQDIRKGDLLFLIDARVYEQQVRQAEAAVNENIAKLRQAEAQLARDQAAAANAQSVARRYTGLASRGIISREQGEQYSTQATTAEETVRASRAAIESQRAVVQSSQSQLADAKLQLSYTQIRSPIDGRTGSLAVKEGNLITANAENPLVVINKITPVYVSFSVPENVLTDLRRFARSGKLAVQAAPAQGSGAASEGLLDFIDNQVDPTTGTIRLRGRFANSDRALWPGEFVNATMTLTTERGVTVVPSAAVQTSQKGPYVMVVKQDMSAEQRTVETSRTFGDKAVIAKGIKPGERIIVDGQAQVPPGGKVRIVQPGQQERVAEQDSQQQPVRTGKS